MRFRFHGVDTGPHVRATVFVGPKEASANAGTLTFRLEEWERFKTLIRQSRDMESEVEITEA